MRCSNSKIQLFAKFQTLQEYISNQCSGLKWSDMIHEILEVICSKLYVHGDHDSGDCNFDEHTNTITFG